MKTLFSLTCCLVLAACSSDDSDSLQSGANCGVFSTIELDFRIEGRLDIADCEIRDFDGSSDVTLADEYVVELDEMGTLTITMESTAVDAYLFLFDASESCAIGSDCTEDNLLAANDDATVLGLSSPRDAQIQITLSEGTYLILANQYERAEGSYTLSASVSR